MGVAFFAHVGSHLALAVLARYRIGPFHLLDASRQRREWCIGNVNVLNGKQVNAARRANARDMTASQQQRGEAVGKSSMTRCSTGVTLSGLPHFITLHGRGQRQRRPVMAGS